MPNARRHPSSKDVVPLMDGWPKSWAGTHEDEPVGRRLVAALQRFMTHLQHQGLSSRTLRRHRDNLWLIGGEIIRQLDDEPALRDKPTHALLLEAIQDGEAPLVRDLTQEQQAALDATARKLLTFVAASNRERSLANLTHSAMAEARLVPPLFTHRFRWRARKKGHAWAGRL